MASTINSPLIHPVYSIGKLKILGSDILDLLNRLSTNNILGLDNFDSKHTILTNDKGRIIDITYLVCLTDEFILLTSTGQDTQVLQWLDKYTIMEDIEYENVTQKYASYHLIGTDSINKLSAFISPKTSNGNVNSITVNDLTGWCMPYNLGSLPSYILIMPNAFKKHYETTLGDLFQEIDEEEYENIRIEHAFPMHGAELNETYNPLEAGLIGAIDFRKGCYIGQEVIARLDTYKKVQKNLVLLNFSNSNEASVNDPLFYNQKKVGFITSIKQDLLGYPEAGLAYINTASAKIGTPVELPSGQVAIIKDIPLLFGEEQ
jgi:folate-binding protein YgfZ